MCVCVYVCVYQAFIAAQAQAAKEREALEKAREREEEKEKEKSSRDKLVALEAERELLRQQRLQQPLKVLIKACRRALATAVP